ncbi:hypothetical protein ACQ86B_28575 (plasmid) [Mycolicibacterium aichiense]|uniref:hypothetical protein n=1 Tax=Mycolicibacterium aichiense TaxID=1799 RepID=UPI003D670917
MDTALAVAVEPTASSIPAAAITDPGPATTVFSDSLGAVGVDPTIPDVPSAPSSLGGLADLVSAAYRPRNNPAVARLAAATTSPTPRVVTKLPLPGGAFPSFAVASPTGARVYVVFTSVLGGGTLPTSSLIGIDTATNSQLGPAVDLGYVAASALVTTVKPIAFSPDGKRVYIASVAQNAGGTTSSQVTIIDAATGQVAGAPIALGSTMASGLTVSPDGGRLYTANSNGTVSVFDLQHGNTAIGAPIPIGIQSGLGGSASDIAITTNNAQTVYISDWADHAVSVLDPSTNTIRQDLIAIDGSPVSMVLTPDNKYLVVNSLKFGGTGSTTNQATLTVIDTATNAVIGSPIPYGDASMGPATTGAMQISPDGRYVYTTSVVAGPQGQTATSWKVDTQTGTAISLPVSGSLTTSLNGQRLYVATTAVTNGTPTSSVVVIDTATNNTVGTVPIDGFPSIAAISPDGARLYVGDVMAAGTDITTVAGEVTVIDTGISNPVPPPAKPPLLQLITKIVSQAQPAVDNTQVRLQKTISVATTHLNNLQALVDDVGRKIQHDISTLNLPALYHGFASLYGVVNDILEIVKKTEAKLPSIFGAAVSVADIPNTVAELEKNLEVAISGGNGNVVAGTVAFVKSLVGVAELTAAVAGLLYGGTTTAAGVAVVDLFVQGASAAVSVFDRALGG